VQLRDIIVRRVLSLFALAITQILSTPGRITTRARGALDRARSAVIGDPRRVPVPRAKRGGSERARNGPRARASETRDRVEVGRSNQRASEKGRGGAVKQAGWKEREQLAARGRGRRIVWA